MFGTLEGEQQTYQAKVTAHNSNTSIQIDEMALRPEMLFGLFVGASKAVSTHM